MLMRTVDLCDHARLITYSGCHWLLRLGDMYRQTYTKTAESASVTASFHAAVTLSRPDCARQTRRAVSNAFFTVYELRRSFYAGESGSLLLSRSASVMGLRDPKGWSWALNTSSWPDLPRPCKAITPLRASQYAELHRLLGRYSPRPRRGVVLPSAKSCMPHAQWLTAPARPIC